jgi:hypothetical protein
LGIDDTPRDSYSFGKHSQLDFKRTLSVIGARGSWTLAHINE